MKISFALSSMVLWGFSLFSQTPSLKLATDSVDRQVAHLIQQMTLDEKIGQLSLYTSNLAKTGPTINPEYLQYIREGKCGAVFNAYSPDFIRKLQKVAVEESHLKIPLFFGFDVIHGHKTIFPIPLGQACSWDLDLIEAVERIAATEAAADGLNWTFAPMVDISRDPRWGRVAEGSGEDTWLGCQIAKARVRGFQGEGVGHVQALLACGKHIAAYGAPVAGREYNTVDMSPISLYETYLPPYKSCVEAGVGSFMTSFNEVNGVPSTANAWLLSDVLRNEWGFKGFVVSDYTSIRGLVYHGIAKNEDEAAKLAFKAGVDMDMQGGNYNAALKKGVVEGSISENQIDAAVERILRVKFQMGLFEDPYRYCNNDRASALILTQENKAIARKMVAKSCVLLKNELETLPITKKVKRIAIIGPLGDDKTEMLGNWFAAGNLAHCITLFEGMKAHVGSGVEVKFERACSIQGEDSSDFNKALKLARWADYVVLALGESGNMTGEASSRSQIGLPGVQNQLAAKITKLGRPTAVVLFNGRPLTISQLTETAPAILESWFGGTETGNGIADVLFGDVVPSGKLTMTFPRNEGQIPIYYNQKPTGNPINPANPGEKYASKYLDVENTPLFPFGFGLSYTKFEYSDFKAVVKNDTIEVQVVVKNVGKVEGEEVVQLYVRDKVATITRPVKELKGFTKINLKRNASMLVKFHLSKRDLAFYHPDLKLYFEPGEFELYVGGDSDASLKTTVELK